MTCHTIKICVLSLDFDANRMVLDGQRNADLELKNSNLTPQLSTSHMKSLLDQSEMSTYPDSRFDLTLTVSSCCCQRLERAGMAAELSALTGSLNSKASPNAC